MDEWNVLVTCTMGCRLHVAKVLRNFGHIKATGYRNVLLGQVESIGDFLDSVKALTAEQPETGRMLGRIIPFDKVFHFTDPKELVTRLTDAVTDYIPRLPGKKFYVRMERRGFRGKISSPEVERAVDDFILETVRETGGEAKVDFEDPDVIIAVEMVSNIVGVSYLTRDLREQYPFVRVE